MSTEANKSLVRAYFEAMNRGDETAPETYLDRNIVCYVGGVPEPIRGIEANRQMEMAFRSAFSNIRYTIEALIAEGDTVASRRKWSMTHTGLYGELPPTGKEISGTAIDLHRIVDGKIVETWSESDNLSFMQQLGVIPASEGGI